MFIVQVSLMYAAFGYFGYISRSGIERSYGSSIFSFFKNTVLIAVINYIATNIV
jgi:hypothetical protein